MRDRSLSLHPFLRHSINNFIPFKVAEEEEVLPFFDFDIRRHIIHFLFFNMQNYKNVNILVDTWSSWARQPCWIVIHCDHSESTRHGWITMQRRWCCGGVIPVSRHELYKKSPHHVRGAKKKKKFIFKLKHKTANLKKKMIDVSGWCEN